MKRILILFFALLAAPLLFAENNSAAQQFTKYMEQFDNCNKRIDVIKAPLSDVSARYWAIQVQEGSVTVKDLERFSKNWVGSEEKNKEEIALIKKYLAKGQTITVTPQEKLALEENTKQVQDLLANGCFPKDMQLDEIKAERDKKIDAIRAPVRDLRARELAREVQTNTVTLDKLQKDSADWLGSKKENQALIESVKKYLADGKPVSLTPEELDRLDKNQRQTDIFLNDGRENPAAAALARKNRQIREIEEPVFELEARYWAYRIAEVKDVTFEELSAYSRNWVGERSYNQKLINKVEENLRNGNTKALTKKENKLLEKTKERIRKLLK